MWIMVAGPYRSGARDEAERQARLDDMNRVALDLFRLGHTPVIGVNMALPMINAAESDCYDEVMMPLALDLADRCDACLRVGGISEGADQEVHRFVAAGKPVYRSLAEVPPCP